MFREAALDDRYLDQLYDLAGRVVDPVVGSVTFNGTIQAIGRKQVEVLACLATAAGGKVLRREIIKKVWEDNLLVGERALTDTVYSLRRSLQDSDRKNPLIRTIPRRGYQLNVSVRLLEIDQMSSFSTGWKLPGRPDWSLVKLLQQNDSSEMWLVENESLQEQRLFRFCRQERYLQRLRREITVLRYLRRALKDHENVVTILDWSLDDPPYYLEMTSTAHDHLSNWSKERGGLHKIPLQDRLQLMNQVASALDAVHSVGLIHRNLRPASILIDDGTDGQVRARLGGFVGGEWPDRADLEAFGITATGLTLPDSKCGGGSSIYLAPERQRGQTAETASDIYAFGLLLFQIITGDLQVFPEEGWEESVENTTCRELIATCMDAQASRRPNAGTLRQRLESLVSSGKLSRAVDPGSLTRPDPVVSIVGQTIGSFRVLDLLGEGGMGSVYLAEQRNPVERQVALKLIRNGRDSEQVLARFEAERQALALMSHPNVATVYDAGAIAGRPYFAMEYVPGIEITTHCDRVKLGIRARLELFLQVCNGVQHSHQKGLIHRDLKPKNILVGGSTGQPVVAKIIDFGVAKSLQGKLSAHTIHTQLGTYVGTPRYASPEQICGHLADVDTRADIYSLGTVLYELVTGVTPYSDNELKGKSLSELVRVLTESEPPTPSARFAHLPSADRSTVAENRSLPIGHLEQWLAADLSWIVVKCLERDPEDRYASVLELKKDLRRLLGDLPVEARPMTPLYRLRKMVKRHRMALTVTLLTTLTLLSTTTLAVGNFFRAEREATRAQASSARAEGAFLEAESAAAFQVEQLRSINPASMAIALRSDLRSDVRRQLVHEGLETAAIEDRLNQLDELVKNVNFTDLTVRQLEMYFVEPALATIKTNYGKFPLLQARLLQTMADLLHHLGRFEAAMEPQEQALAIRRQILGPRHPLTLESIQGRGILLKDLSQYGPAEADLREVLEGTRITLGYQQPETFQAINNLGNLLRDRGKLSEAEAFMREALEGRQRLLGDRHPSTLESIQNIGNLYFVSGDLDLAETRFREALEGRLSVLGPKHPKTLNSISMLGRALKAQGALDEALLHFNNLLDYRVEVLGTEHPDTLRTLNLIAVTLGALGHHAEAESHAREALEIRQRTLGRSHPSTFLTIADVGTFMGSQGRLDEAEQYLQEAADGLLRTMGDKHHVTLGVLIDLGDLLVLKGELKSAELQFRYALASYEDSLGKQHPDTLWAAGKLAHVFKESGALEESSAICRESMESARRVFAPNPIRLDLFYSICGVPTSSGLTD